MLVNRMIMNICNEYDSWQWFKGSGSPSWLDTAVNIHQAWIVFLFTEIYIKETTVSHKLCPPRAAQKCHREVSLSMPAN